MSVILTVIIALALFFSFLNGMHDSRNVVTTIVSSRAYSSRVALAVTVLAELVGPFLFGLAVAHSIGSGIAAPAALTYQVLLTALISAVAFNGFTWALRVPSSSSHALIGGIVGAVLAGTGIAAIQGAGLLKILVSLFASPVLGFAVGYLVMLATLWFSRESSPRVNEFFKRVQILTAIGLGLSHGSNDSQKSMGLISLALMLGKPVAAKFVVPFWVVAACAGALSLGTLTGGWLLLRKPGSLFYKIKPVDGFAAQFTSALIILSASLFGGPVSATQVINTAVMGVGAGERANKVRWGIARDIVAAWILTIPSSALMAMGIYSLLSRYLF